MPTEPPVDAPASARHDPEVLPTAPPIEPPPAVALKEPPQEPPTERIELPVHRPEQATQPLADLVTEQMTLPGTPPTELRVHGVSGTPAEEMLDRAIIGQVAGDSGAGFFRPRSEYGATRGPGGALLEAYRWGNLTAGAAARAFWLLLLPFTLVNVSLWLRPPAVGLGRAVVHVLCRVFALTLSATFTLAMVGVSLDLIAWQCPQYKDACMNQHSWISGVFSGQLAQTGRRLAIATVGPILLVALLWFLARRTWGKYESYQLDRAAPQGDGLATPTFWDGKQQVSRLRILHIATM